MVVVRIESHRLPWQTVAACACFVGAVLAAAVGSLLTTTSLLSAQLHPLLHALGLMLLIVAIPILILGGHCLDLVDRRADRASQSRRQWSHAGAGPDLDNRAKSQGRSSK